MKYLKRIYCWWMGHQTPPRVTTGDFICDRCGGWTDWYQWGAWKRFLYWFYNRKYAFKTWWKCPDCKHHFGRHDESVDHLPF